MTRPDEPDRPEWLEAVPADEPPASFADRVVQAWQRESAANKVGVVSGTLHGRARRLMPLAAGAIAAAAVGVLIIIALQPDDRHDDKVHQILPFPAVEPSHPADVYREWKAENPIGKDRGESARPNVETPYRARKLHEETDKLQRDDPDQALRNIHRESGESGMPSKNEAYRQKIESLKSAVLEGILVEIDEKEDVSVPPVAATEEAEDEVCSRVKRLYEEAYRIKGSNPQGALERLHEARDLLPTGGASVDVYREKINELTGKLTDELESAREAGKKALNKDILRTLKKYKQALKKCVRKQRERDPGVTGTMMVSFTILPVGTVQKVLILSAEHRDTYAAGCVSNIIKTMKFPAFDGDPIVPKFPLRLGP